MPDTKLDTRLCENIGKPKADRTGSRVFLTNVVQRFRDSANSEPRLPSHASSRSSPNRTIKIDRYIGVRTKLNYTPLCVIHFSLPFYYPLFWWWIVIRLRVELTSGHIRWIDLIRQSSPSAARKLIELLQLPARDLHDLREESTMPRDIRLDAITFHQDVF